MSAAWSPERAGGQPPRLTDLPITVATPAFAAVVTGCAVFLTDLIPSTLGQ